MKTVRRISPKRKFKGKGISPHISALMFWRWGFSDVRSNVTRGVLAEFLVACALGLQKKPRMAWSSHDLEYKGKKIEVKATGYLQTWSYGKGSKPGFTIRPSAAYDPSAGYGKSKEFNADIYVLCLFKATKERTSEMDVDQWTFWVLDRAEVQELFTRRRRFPVEWLQNASGVRPVSFAGLRSAIERAGQE